MKLIDVENELTNQVPRVVEFKCVPLDFIHEVARVYNCKVTYGSLNTWIAIQRNKVKLTLNTSNL
jgi:hypothetical protein